MKIGTVTDTLRLRTRSEYSGEQTFVQVMTEEGALAAADLAGARPGDRVLVLAGEGALRCCLDTPTDAVITAIVEKD